MKWLSATNAWRSAVGLIGLNQLIGGIYGIWLAFDIAYRDHLNPYVPSWGSMQISLMVGCLLIYLLCIASFVLLLIRPRAGLVASCIAQLLQVPLIYTSKFVYEVFVGVGIMWNPSWSRPWFVDFGHLNVGFDHRGPIENVSINLLAAISAGMLCVAAAMLWKKPFYKTQPTN